MIIADVIRPPVSPVMPRRSRASYRCEAAQFQRTLSSARLEGKNYTVQKGDTLYEIVDTYLGAKDCAADPATIMQGVAAISEKNAIEDPDLIFPGQKLDLSVLDEETEAFQQVSPVQPFIAPTIESPPNAALSATENATLGRGGGAPTTDLSEVIAQKLHFSPNKALPSDSKSWARVVDGPVRISSLYGLRTDPVNGKRAFHRGLDLAAAQGTPIHPVAPGTVTFSGPKGGYGNLIIVRHEGGVESYYGHAARTCVSVGDRVTPESILAEVGATGRATGPHVHLEIRRGQQAINPLSYLQ